MALSVTHGSISIEATNNACAMLVTIAASDVKVRYVNAEVTLSI